jgi:N-acetylmuramoyl-L-alanine amidase
VSLFRRILPVSLFALSMFSLFSQVGSSPDSPAGISKTKATLSAAAASERLRAKLSYDPVTGYGFLERGGIRAIFSVDQPYFLLDWKSVNAMEAPRAVEGVLSFTEDAIASIEKAFDGAESRALANLSVAAILIDPGHGGKDPGAIGEHAISGKRLRIIEKDIALDISKILYTSLARRFPEKRILITREGDSYPTLEERVEMANAVDLAPNEAIIYISLHANSSFNKSARGFEVWYLNPEYRRTVLEAKGGSGQDIAPILNAMLEEEYTTESILLARDITASLQASIGQSTPNRGIRADEWFVVRNARMPSILVEAGFVTNADEAKLLSQPDYLQRLAEGLYNGVVQFIGYFESMRGAVPQ